MSDQRVRVDEAVALLAKLRGSGAWTVAHDYGVTIYDKPTLSDDEEEVLSRLISPLGYLLGESSIPVPGPGRGLSGVPTTLEWERFCDPDQ